MLLPISNNHPSSSGFHLTLILELYYCTPIKLLLLFVGPWLCPTYNSYIHTIRYGCTQNAK